MQAVQSFRTTYAGLLILRACFAVFGTGFIHPDEYFQNGEVTAGRILGYHTLRTWEWDPGFPVRSILLPFLTTGIPFWFTKMSLPKEQFLGPSLIFCLERLSSFITSLFLDYSVSLLVHNSESRRRALLLLASSHVMQTFQMRPFSNSIEAVLVALCFVVFRTLVEDRQRNHDKKSNLRLHILAVLFVIGIFTRVTFVAFVLPIGWQLFHLMSAKSDRTGRSLWYTQAHRLLPPTLTTCLTTLAVILVDTYYFRGDFSTLVITPLNFVLYNLSPKNLAEHGIHPRWLHLLVNLPIMVGPPLLWLAVLASLQHWRIPAEKQADTNHIVDQTVMYGFFVAIAVLSVQPHQEPRFLTPCLVLFVIFVANSGNLLRTGKIFWATWITTNVLLAFLFGVLHQGGVVPSLFYLHDRISAGDFTENAHIIYWKTYMPPQHLLGIEERDIISGRFNVIDLAGISPTSLYRYLPSPSFPGKNGIPPHSRETTFLVTTFPMKASLPAETVACFSLHHTVFPHLDLDHIGESMEGGWRDGLTLGVWKVNNDCILNIDKVE